MGLKNTYYIYSTYIYNIYIYTHIYNAIYTHTHIYNAIYTHTHIYKITNKDLLYSEGNYIQYLIITYNGKESEVVHLTQ